MREGMAALVASLGYRAEVYSSGEEFIDAAMKSEAGCLLVDIELGDITGVELVRHLSAMGLTFPVIFMTGSRDATVKNRQPNLDASPICSSHFRPISCLRQSARPLEQPAKISFAAAVGSRLLET